MTRRPYALFDLDGTLSRGYISLAFMDDLHRRGLYDDADYQHQQVILNQYKAKTLSYDDWVSQWGQTWAHGLKGQKESKVRQAARKFFEAYRSNLYPEARILVSDLKAHGLENVMVSAGVFEVVDEARRYLGLDRTEATRVRVENGIYTGELTTELHTPTGKAALVQQLTAAAGIGPNFAFGDSSGDIGMLSLARVPVALNPNADLSQEAARRGWAQMPIADAPAFLQRQWLLLH